MKITNGQRAAVAGLVLAGVRFDTACTMVQAGHKAMRRHMPGHLWRVEKRPKRPTPKQVAARAAYEDSPDKIDAIARDINVNRNTLYTWAREGRWKRRGRAWKKRLEAIQAGASP